MRVFAPPLDLVLPLSPLSPYAHSTCLGGGRYSQGEGAPAHQKKHLCCGVGVKRSDIDSLLFLVEPEVGSECSPVSIETVMGLRRLTWGTGGFFCG